MVYCSSCGTANRDGSSFCNDCGAKLPSGTSLRCPQCGTPNSPSDTFCEKCGTRLVPTLAENAPVPDMPAVPLKKGLSLPTIPDADTSPVSTDSGEPASTDDTLVPSPAAEPPATAGEVPDWLTSLGIISDNPPLTAAADDDVPEWLSQLPPDTATSIENATAPEASTEPADPADWLSSLRAAAPVESSSSDDDEIPEWLRALGTGPLASPQPDRPAATTGSQDSLVRPVASADDEEEDIPDWMRALGTGPLPSKAIEPTPLSPVTPAEPEDTTDWLTNLRAAESAVEPEPIAEVDPTESLPAAQPPAPAELPDWLRNLSEADHSQRSTDELPEWLDSLETESASPETSANETETPAEDDVPAWLRELGASAVTQPTESQQAELSTTESSDWMSSLRATASQPDESAEQESEPAADESSDWMSSLRATASQPSESAEPESEPTAEEVPDWLQGMGLPASDQAPTSAADESADWMSSLRATASQPSESAEPESEPTAEEVPDWLQGMGLPASDQAPTPAADESSDWMSSLRATASQPSESAEPESEPAAEEVPDWLQAMELPATDQAPTSAADESSDWMSSLRATASQPNESAEPESEPAAEEVPDWLQEMGLPASDQAPTSTADESSDWMSSLRATASQPAETGEPENESAGEEVPDWLQEMGLPATDQVPAPATDESSDWMSSLRATSDQPAESAEPESEPAADEVPDWLRNFDEPTAQSVDAESPVSPSAAEDVPDWLRAAGADNAAQPAPMESGDLPDWLKNTSAAAEPEPASSVEPASELPTWLSDLQPLEAISSIESESVQPEQPAPAPIGETEPQPIVSHIEEQPFDQAAPADLPDWLKSLREGKPAVPIQTAEPLPGLTQAEIPSWLEALRPKEGPTTAVTDLTAESDQEGIFAGLVNVLPPLPGLDEIPAKVSHDITGPSADDLARAGIFQELLTRPISRPTAVAALTTSGKPVQRRLLQWAIAIALLVVVVAPFLELTQGLPFLPQADQLPPSALVQAAATRVTVLPPNAKVLVVFDYEPAQAGEMNRIAEVVLRHLQTRAANITAVSLNPLGADLAASVWAGMGASTGGQRNNLGYVPGQAIGVQNVLLNNGPFELVIDLSASSDSIRWWVEQIAVAGYDVPFIAGVSAAVESLALPYAQSGQITGLISGAVGAMMYARQAGLLPSLQEALQEAQVARNLDQAPSAEVVRALHNQVQIESQTLAHWLLVVLIVLGLVSGLVSRAGRRSAS